MQLSYAYRADPLEAFAATHPAEAAWIRQAAAPYAPPAAGWPLAA